NARAATAGILIRYARLITPLGSKKSFTSNVMILGRIDSGPHQAVQGVMIKLDERLTPRRASAGRDLATAHGRPTPGDAGREHAPTRRAQQGALAEAQLGGRHTQQMAYGASSS